MKNVILTAVATVAVICALSRPAKADHIEDHSFLQVPEKLQLASKQTVFDRVKSINSLTNEQLEKFQHVASEQAEIWGDTILEGDYEADGETIVDQVEEMKIDGDLVAYKVTYSQRGWETSLCTYPGNRDGSALNQCKEGRIVESSFVSPDLTSWTRDSDHFATFESN